MPSFQDSAFLILLALLLFGPKGLAKLARELGKLMGEFRRASTEFRMQMEDEFRLSEQEEQRKKIAAMEAAAPVAPQLGSEIPEPEHPHLPPPAPSMLPETSLDTVVDPIEPAGDTTEHHIDSRAHEGGETMPTREPLPIATEGKLNMMPPATGLPVGRASAGVNGVFESAPRTEAATDVAEREHEATNHG